MSVEHHHAYAAGLFDGEGCVIVAHNGKGWYTQLQLSNCDRRALDFMVELFGGWINPANEKRTWGFWSISGEGAKFAAEKMIPYSVLKREQLEFFVEFRETFERRGRALDVKTVRRRETLKRKIDSLKRPKWVAA